MVRYSQLILYNQGIGPMLLFSSKMNDTVYSKDSLKTAFVALVFISCGSVTINILSIVTLSQCVRIDKRIKVMIRNIALADTFLGCTPAVALVNDYIGVSDTNVGCRFQLILSRLLTFTKMFSVSILAVDRFVCLYFSNWYLKHVSERLTIAVSLGMWLVSLCITIGTYASGVSYIVDCFNENTSNGLSVLLVTSVACGIIIIGAYTGVFLNFKRHTRETKTLNISSRSSQTNAFRSTMILCLLMLVFVICYTPTGVYRTMIYLYPDRLFKTGGIRNITNIIFMMSTIINPFLYVWRFNECRIRMSKLFCRCNKEYLERLDRRQKIMCASFLQETTIIPQPYVDKKVDCIDTGESHI